MNRSSCRIKTGLILAFSLVLFACASSSDKIATSYVSPTQYKSFNCDQLSLELVRLNARKSELAASLDKAASNDEALTAVSIILFWPAAFALGGNEAQEMEYARLKGEYDAVQQAAIEKNCKLDPNKAGVSPLVKSFDGGGSENESVYAYYGEAESELNSGDVDKNLWARALVEAEGDEAKRKAKYIELRAYELYLKDGGVPVGPVVSSSYGSDAVLDSSPGTLSGIYRSKISGSYRSSSDFQLVHEGEKVTGVSADKVWEIEGVYDDNTFKFDWYNNSNKGKGKLVLDSNGNLSGEYRGDSWGKGKWQMNRIE